MLRSCLLANVRLRSGPGPASAGQPQSRSQRSMTEELLRTVHPVQQMIPSHPVLSASPDSPAGENPHTDAAWPKSQEETSNGPVFARSLPVTESDAAALRVSSSPNHPVAPSARTRTP